VAPSHDIIVQHADLGALGARRRVGQPVAVPALGEAWQWRGDLRGRAHLRGDEGVMERAALNALEAEVAELVLDLYDLIRTVDPVHCASQDRVTSAAGGSDDGVDGA
jgi:hypothetical protein